MTDLNLPAKCNNRVTTPLAKPYHYRRKGTYYLRMRPEGSVVGLSVSLRSTHKAIAMQHSEELQAVVKGWQLDNPNATWEDLRAILREESDRLLRTKIEPLLRADTYNHYQSEIDLLMQIAAEYPLRSVHVTVLECAVEMFKAAQRRLHSQPRPLLELKERFDQEAFEGLHAPASVSLSPSVSGPQAPSSNPAKPTVKTTFRELADTYLAEQRANLKPTTIKNTTSYLKILSEAFTACGVDDVQTHTRADLVRIKEHLGKGSILKGDKGRSVSTVNVFVSYLATVFTWATDNGLLKHNYSQRLKTTKGATSTRTGFTVPQVEAVLKTARDYSTEAGRAATLAAITGARLNEVLQLRKRDVQGLDGGPMAISINEAAEGKSVKNKGSIRVVPLVMTSSWAPDMEAFREFVKALPDDDSPVFTRRSLRLDLAKIIRTAVGDNPDLVFHSLRHTMSTLLQNGEVSLQTAASILGHTTKSITFDTYGGNMAQDTLRAALEKVLPKA
ncbi:tyrosine-type recombinase/integrase [Pseudomonas rubra]|uniref:Tyrosine-type recombinase/integrase n=1 Tax=Pseudomonas rubra TaxID=2942627 RepID=A0ABT5P6U3_9PSED|nr:tyrosine-type recombinase/integrase [Pseudomonas rubra]MDD1013882.1 tyrosine-type recombinase/integrase [Pseudomonas rubra]MDD1038297.1 tyrosine-type recombinase/integrase [Pseudomonas rubra]MDD1154613.1 tyrosine-type recombinase/integrase [Pseudomonas rubra]